MYCGRDALKLVLDSLSRDAREHSYLYLQAEAHSACVLQYKLTENIIIWNLAGLRTASCFCIQNVCIQAEVSECNFKNIQNCCPRVFQTLSFGKSLSDNEGEFSGKDQINGVAPWHAVLQGLRRQPLG